jgi:hypothetical protein
MERLGWTVREVSEGRLRLLEGVRTGGRRVHVRPKAKTGGSWQAPASNGTPAPKKPPVPTFWAFVDLGTTPPATFVAPDDWVRRDIYDAHQAYLRRHGGHRAVNDKSDHHSIEVERIEQWRGRWDVLDGEASMSPDS